MSDIIYNLSHIILSCDHKTTNPLLRHDDPEKIPSTFPKCYGEVVYIFPYFLGYFIKYYLPRINTEFVLVTAEEDLTIPEDIQEFSNLILDNEYLICWYAQNCIGGHPKLRQLPIGINFYCLAAGIQPQWGPQQSFDSQMNDIKLLLKETKDKERLPLCYGNFHFNFDNQSYKYKYDRIDALNSISKELVYYEEKFLPRIESWRNMIKYKFVISPHGNGLDCHRTYEALALGCIPIIKSSPLNTLYEGLPIIIVNNWSDVTEELLNKEYVYNGQDYSEKMLLKYWINEIHQFKK